MTALKEPEYIRIAPLVYAKKRYSKLYGTLQDTYTYSSGELRPLMNNTVSVNNAHFILIDPVEGLLFFTNEYCCFRSILLLLGSCTHAQNAQEEPENRERK